MPYINGNEVVFGVNLHTTEGYTDKDLQDAYDNGLEEGNAIAQQKYEEGIEQGKQAEYDEFWDIFQQKGNYFRHEYRFSGSAWNDTNFKPKYDINATNADHIFYGTVITNLAEILKKRGLKLDVSQATNHSYAYAGCDVTHFPVMDLSNAKDTNGVFSYNNCMVEIEKLIVSENTKFANGSFMCSGALETIIFDGVWANNNLNFQWSSKLNKESIRSIINCLSTTTSGLSITLSLTAVKKAFETSSGANDGNTSEEWLNLIATKSNWTINLV